MSILPVGMGAYTHRSLAQAAEGKGAAVEGEALRLLARIEGALAAIAVIVVLAAFLLAGAGSVEAADKAARLDGADESDVREAFLAVRSSHRRTGTGATIAFTTAGVTLLLGVYLYATGARLILRDVHR